MVVAQFVTVDCPLLGSAIPEEGTDIGGMIRETPPARMRV
jgi:hypothetical protein